MTTFRNRISKAIGALLARSATNSVTGDSTSAPATPWGTSSTGRGTDPGGMPSRSLQDMKPVERKVSIARSRFIVNRTGLGRAMVEGSARYAINEGLVAYAATGDPAFDDSCNRVCDALFEASEEDTRIDVTGGLNWYEQQEVVAPQMMMDGDCGAAKILRRDLNGRVVDTPKLQLFATDQISDSYGYGFAPDRPQERWSEGVLRDEYGKALKYRVQLDAAPGYPRSSIFGSQINHHVDFDARDFMLVLDPKRIGIGRGLPWTHHGQSSAITMMDLKTLEESAAYLNAFFGAVITTPDGEIPEGFEAEVFRNRATKTSEKKTSGTVEKEIMRKYANFMGGTLIPVLKEGEKLEMVKSERPSLTFTGFMDWLVNDIAWGFGIPPSFVWAIAGRTGPETRFTLSQADWFFKFIMRRMISRFCKPARDFIIRWGLLTGRINNGKPPHNGASPFLCRWHGPRKITIDERYYYRTWLERLDKGLGTEEEFYADLGLEAADVRRARVLEVKDWMALCEEHGVPYEMVKTQMPGQNSGSTGNLDIEDIITRLKEAQNAGEN